VTDQAQSVRDNLAQTHELSGEGRKYSLERQGALGSCDGADSDLAGAAIFLSGQRGLPVFIQFAHSSARVHRNSKSIALLFFAPATGAHLPPQPLSYLAGPFMHVAFSTSTRPKKLAGSARPHAKKPFRRGFIHLARPVQLPNA
jgi:hypothetical protein